MTSRSRGRSLIVSELAIILGSVVLISPPYPSFSPLCLHPPLPHQLLSSLSTWPPLRKYIAAIDFKQCVTCSYSLLMLGELSGMVQHIKIIYILKLPYTIPCHCHPYIVHSSDLYETFHYEAGSRMCGKGEGTCRRK